MGSSRFIRTPKLEIVLQVTEVTVASTDGRAWVVHDVERNRGFRVTLTSGALRETPRGRQSIRRPVTEDEIDGGLGLAIERALVTPPEKVGGAEYDVAITSDDLYDFLELRA